MLQPDTYAPQRELLESGWLSLLHSQARLLRAHLQVWSPAGTLLGSAPTDVQVPDLARCAELAHRCVHERRPLWEGAGGRHPLLALPVFVGGQVMAVFTGRWWIEPAAIPGGSSTPAAEPGRSGPWSDPILPGATGQGLPASSAVLRSSLEALATLLGRQFDLLHRFRVQGDELTCARNQQGLLHRIASQRADPADWRQTLDFILRQGCAATGADLALLQLPTQRAPLIERHPFRTDGPPPLSAKDLRQLAAQIWWSMRAWPGLQIDGPLERFLGPEPPLAGPLQVSAIRLNPQSTKAGFLAFLRHGQLPFARHQLGLLPLLAQQVTLTMHDADLHEDVSGFLMSTVKALVSAIETKDRYTSGHSARVNLIAMLIGKQMAMPPDAMEALKWASILHDVGKIGMPEAILNKPGRLSEEEYEVVKQHPWRGYEVVGHIEQLKIASQAVLFHHERMDGLGYPLGISGQAIPALARIIAVADTFDALTSRRPYRDAWEIDQAFAEIGRVSGSQLDPQVVETLGVLLPFLREHHVMLETAEVAG